MVIEEQERYEGWCITNHLIQVNHPGIPPRYAARAVLEHRPESPPTLPGGWVTISTQVVHFAERLFDTADAAHADALFEAKQHIDSLKL
jgi:hypothetical protein